MPRQIPNAQASASPNRWKPNFRLPPLAMPQSWIDESSALQVAPVEARVFSM